LIKDVRVLVARHLPGYEVASISRLGEGLDNVAFEVNGELIVRLSKEADPAGRAEATRREAELLGVVAELSTLPVPEVAFVDAAAGVLGYRKLAGRPLLEAPVARPERLAAPLGEFVSGLHRAPLERVAGLVPVDDEPPTVWLSDAQAAYREVAGQLPADAQRLVERFLAEAPPPEPPEPPDRVFCHNDLGAEHILVDQESSTITGVIDWTDAAVGDPAADLALICRDLGPDVFELTLAHYDGQWDAAARERARFYARCALLEDLAYGLRTGARPYARAALAHLPRTFG
jgi:aminoglycoside phosphotransferase (APT) family kinase protein